MSDQTPHTAAELRDEMRVELTAAYAEIARLRKTLQWIADLPHFSRFDSMENMDMMEKHARAALA